MAGAVRLHPTRFLIWDLVAVVIWVPGSVLAGNLAGASYQRLAEHISNVTLVVIAALALILTTIYLTRRRARRSPDLAPADLPPAG